MHTLDLDMTTDCLKTFVSFTMQTIKKLYLSEVRNPDKSCRTIYLVGAQGDEACIPTSKRYPGYSFHFGPRVEKNHPTDQVLFTINSYVGNEHIKQSSACEPFVMSLDRRSASQSKKKRFRPNDKPFTYTEASWNKLEKTIRKKLESLEFLQPTLFDIPEDADDYLYQDHDISLEAGYRLVVCCRDIAIIQTLTHYGK